MKCSHLALEVFILGCIDCVALIKLVCWITLYVGNVFV